MPFRDQTGTIARVLDLFARLTPEATLKGPQKYMAEMTREQVAGKIAWVQKQMPVGE